MDQEKEVELLRMANRDMKKDIAEFKANLTEIKEELRKHRLQTQMYETVLERKRVKKRARDIELAKGSKVIKYKLDKHEEI